MELKKIIEIDKRDKDLCNELKALASVCSKDEAKYYLQFVNINLNNKALYATNGRSALKLNEQSVAGAYLLKLASIEYCNFCKIEKNIIKLFHESESDKYPNFEKSLFNRYYSNAVFEPMPSIEYKYIKKYDDTFLCGVAMAYCNRVFQPCFFENLGVLEFARISYNNECFIAENNSTLFYCMPTVVSVKKVSETE